MERTHHEEVRTPARTAYTFSRAELKRALFWMVAGRIPTVAESNQVALWVRADDYLRVVSIQIPDELVPEEMRGGHSD